MDWNLHEFVEVRLHLVLPFDILRELKIVLCSAPELNHCGLVNGDCDVNFCVILKDNLSEKLQNKANLDQANRLGVSRN